MYHLLDIIHKQPIQTESSGLLLLFWGVVPVLARTIEPCLTCIRTVRCNLDLYVTVSLWTVYTVLQSTELWTSMYPETCDWTLKLTMTYRIEDTLLYKNPSKVYLKPSFGTTIHSTSDTGYFLYYLEGKSWVSVVILTTNIKYPGVIHFWLFATRRRDPLIPTLWTYGVEETKEGRTEGEYRTTRRLWLNFSESDDLRLLLIRNEVWSKT